MALTEHQVSLYLKTHPDFLLRWLADNTTTEIVEQFASTLRQNKFDEGYKQASRIPSTVHFPMPPYSLITRNSITSAIFRRYLEGDRKDSVRKDRKSLVHMSEEELFMELIRDIASELDVNLLCHKILQNVSILTNSDRGSLFLVRGSRDNKYLVSKLFDVTETSTLEDVVHTQVNEIKVPFGKGIVGLVAQTGEAINIKNAYEDPRFNQEIDKQTGYRTHSILSMPIVNFENEVIGVAQIINKIDGNHEFTKQDEKLFRKYLIFCGIGITNAQLFEMSVTEFRRNQLLLHLARGIFEEQTNLEKLVQKIMLDAQDLLKCEKCSVYLLDDTLERDPTSQLELTGSDLTNCLQDTKVHNVEDVVFSRAFELCSKDGAITLSNSQELAQSKTAYIAKSVVVKGEIVNIPDVDVDGRFGKGPLVDARGCRIRSVLCMPIQNSDKKIIGVTQLLNKNNGEPFNDSDVNIIEAFSIFTGLGIHNCQMYENVCQLMAKQSVALEVLSYHATSPVEEAQELAKSTIPTAEDMRLLYFDFDDMTLGDDGTLKACVRMFMEADLINIFRVPYEVICRWLCTVKKNYRPVTYHNWRHAFNVCQSMFTMLYTGELRPLFDDLEVLSLLAACLCHDLDHRGTNNAFQTKVASPLAMLYSTSVLEHHHFDHCIMILNSEGNNIFQSLPPNQYRRAIKFLEHAILSTDLALYFKKRGDFKKLVESGERSFVDPQHKSLLRAMMMTACDVAAVTKPWSIQHKTALLVTAEFFEQGDIERTQLGEQPIPMMDRNKKDELPKMQIGFIDAICTPIYKLFAIMTTKLEPMYAGCENNRDKWQELADEHDKNHAVQTAFESTSQQEASTLQINADKQKSSHSQNIIINDPNGGGDKENQQLPLIINSVQTNFASPQTSELKNIPCTSSHLSVTSISENNNELSTHSEPKHIQEIPRYCNSSPKESAQDATVSIDNKDFAKSEPVDSNRTHDKTYDRPHSAQDVSRHQQEYPPKLPSQNGSLSDGQTTKSHDFASAPSCYVSNLANSPIPSHGKRKSYAQAHAYVSKDKGDRTQSGLCLVS